MDNFDKLIQNLILFNESFKIVSVSAEQAAAAISELSTALNRVIPKEIKIMLLKLNLLKARLHTLEGRNTECEAIRKKLRRQIRNLEAKMAI